MVITSTEIGSIAKIVGEEKAVELVAKAGFDAYDLSMFAMARLDRATGGLLDEGHPLAGTSYLAFVRRLAHIAKECGIFCNQSHAPFPTYGMPAEKYLLRAIECTAEAGGKICVIHPGNNATPEENAEMYGKLLPFAKSCGVKIATENMWNWNREEKRVIPAACSDPASFNAHLDAVGDPDFVACLDLGHAEMRGLNTSAVEMIRALDKRLAALHIHDNDQIGDLHALPETMKIDFNAILRALREIDYKGDFTLEADSYLRSFCPDADAVPEGVRRMAEKTRELARRFEAL